MIPSLTTYLRTWSIRRSTFRGKLAGELNAGLADAWPLRAITPEPAFSIRF
jgi:hypothetical protein